MLLHDLSLVCDVMVFAIFFIANGLAQFEYGIIQSIWMEFFYLP